jgi:hypothetical protein
MANEPERAQHEMFAKRANGATWELLDQETRTRDEDDQMLDAAHASSFHWRVAGGAPESTRADWLLSRVYAVLGLSEPAVRYARHALATCEREGIGDFDLMYAFEAMARSEASAGNFDEAREWKLRATEAAEEIADPEDRKIAIADLAAEPWFGL